MHIISNIYLASEKSWIRSRECLLIITYLALTSRQIPHWWFEFLPRFSELSNVNSSASNSSHHALCCWLIWSNSSRAPSSESQVASPLRNPDMSASATPAATPPKRIVRKHGACATCIRIKRRVCFHLYMAICLRAGSDWVTCSAISRDQLAGSARKGDSYVNPRTSKIGVVWPKVTIRASFKDREV